MPNLVPYDKFRPGNMEKAWEYLNHIARISPERLKYGDEKSLKGKSIFNKLARRDVLMGLFWQRLRIRIYAILIHLLAYVGSV